MNWKNLDLKRGSFERDAKLVEPLTCDTLLLEIGCNLPEINAATVTRQFEEDLESRIEEARSIFALNLDNLVKQAKEDRKP